MQIPTELEVWHDDEAFLVRFDFEPGERQWWDAAAGIGHPGSPARAIITAVNRGDGWKDPESIPGLDLVEVEADVLEQLADMAHEEEADRAEAAFDAIQESYYDFD